MAGQNDLEYLQDIATDRGKMGLVSGRRGNTLSPEDLADLNRSLNSKLQSTASINNAAQAASRLGQEQEQSEEDSNIFSGLTVHNTSPKRSSSHAKLVTPSSSADANRQQGGSSPFAISEDHLDSSASPSRGYRSPLNSKSNDRAVPAMSSGSGKGKLTRLAPSSSERGQTAAVAISAYKHTAPIGPTSLVLTHRGFKLMFADVRYRFAHILLSYKLTFLFCCLPTQKKLIVIHCLQCLVAGALIGSVYWDMDNGNYQERMSLFAVSYVAVNLFIVDSLEGIYLRKEAFLRESFVDASGFLSYYMSDTAPSLCLYAVGAVIFIAPIYILSGLREGAGECTPVVSCAPLLCVLKSFVLCAVFRPFYILLLDRAGVGVLQLLAGLSAVHDHAVPGGVQDGPLGGDHPAAAAHVGVSRPHLHHGGLVSDAALCSFLCIALCDRAIVLIPCSSTYLHCHFLQD